MSDDSRSFPIQGGTATDENGDAVRPITQQYPCTVPWWLAEVAYESYVESGGRGQTLERLAERGGFGRKELVGLIRREFEGGPKMPKYAARDLNKLADELPHLHESRVEEWQDALRAVAKALRE